MQQPINKRLTEVLKVKRVSVLQAARDISANGLKISSQAIYASTSGVTIKGVKTFTNPNYATLKAIIETYGINPSWLFSGVGSMFSDDQKNTEAILEEVETLYKKLDVVLIDAGKVKTGLGELTK